MLEYGQYIDKITVVYRIKQHLKCLYQNCKIQQQIVGDMCKKCGTISGSECNSLPGENACFALLFVTIFFEKIIKFTNDALQRNEVNKWGFELYKYQSGDLNFNAIFISSTQLFSKYWFKLNKGTAISKKKKESSEKKGENLQNVFYFHNKKKKKKQKQEFQRKKIFIFQTSSQPS